VIGTLLFVLVAVAVFAAAYFTITGGSGSSDSASPTTTIIAPGSTTTTGPPFSGPYKVTTGVNVRQGPGIGSSVVGTVETGRSVFVVCVAQGDTVQGPAGPDPKWVKITGLGPQGYVSAAYVTIGDDLQNGKIPACPAA
jgi:uncharacterized protein YgiM (DUF1202 family)